MFSEVEDVRRRHSVYYDVYNTHGWIDPPDMQWRWNIVRGFIVGFASAAVGQLCSFYFNQYHLIRTKYNPPENLAQLTSYIRTAHKLENFRFNLKYRSQAAVLHGIDYMIRLIGFKHFVSGIGQIHFATNFDYWRRVLPTMLFSLLCCPFLAPVEATKAAFKADRTFPKEMRIGYKSLFDTFFKIAKENPMYFFKNSSFVMFASYIQTSFLFSIYEYNMELFLPVYHEEVGGSRAMVKTFSAGLASLGASMFSFPVMVTVRNVIEVYPRQISQDFFKGAYRKAFWYFWSSELWSQAWVGYFKSGYFFKNYPTMFALVWLADNFGYFKGPRADFTRPPGTNSFGTFNM